MTARTDTTLFDLLAEAQDRLAQQLHGDEAAIAVATDALALDLATHPDLEPLAALMEIEP